LDTPDWLKDSSGYKMYYFGNIQNGAAGGCIGLATSPDGIHWTRSGPQPVLSPGNPGDWDGLFIADPTVLFDGTSYFMWFTGADTTWQARIGFATSPDGFTWTKYGGNPILTGGNPQPNYSWEGFGVACPTVLKRNNKFEMYYCGVSWWDFADNGVIDTIKNGYATSTDGSNWVKDPQNPIFNTYSAGYKITEYRGPWTPDAIFMPDESKYYIWYETAYGFGLATADDNSVSINNPHPENNQVYLFPVPAASSLTIKISGISSKDLNTVAIYNETGNEVLRKTLTGNVLHLDVSGLSAGIYLVAISNSKTFHSRKFQKL